MSQSEYSFRLGRSDLQVALCAIFIAGLPRFARNDGVWRHCEIVIKGISLVCKLGFYAPGWLANSNASTALIS